MGVSVWQLLIIAVIVVLLFGRGKISDLMGDVAKGVKSFRKGLADDEDDEDELAELLDVETALSLVIVSGAGSICERVAS